MNQNKLLFSIALSGSCAALWAQNVARPNVLLIYADDLGYGDLECYDAKNVKTPNVNALAQDGILFTNAHAVAATSTPSRYSLLTGEYAWRKKGTDVAAGNAGMIISPGQYTLADVFKKWDSWEDNRHMENIWNAVEARANEVVRADFIAQKDAR